MSIRDAHRARLAEKTQAKEVAPTATSNRSSSGALSHMSLASFPCDAPRSDPMQRPGRAEQVSPYLVPASEGHTGDSNRKSSLWGSSRRRWEQERNKLEHGVALQESLTAPERPSNSTSETAAVESTNASRSWVALGANQYTAPSGLLEDSEDESMEEIPAAKVPEMKTSKACWEGQSDFPAAPTGGAATGGGGKPCGTDADGEFPAAPTTIPGTTVRVPPDSDETQEVLRRQIAALQAQLSEKQGGPEECCICLEKPRDAVLLGCGHRVCCFDCAQQIQECPVCRGQVQSVVKTFCS